MLLLEDGEGETEREAKPVETANTTMSVTHFKHINVESEAENASEHQISKLNESSLEVGIEKIGRNMPISSHQSAGNLHNIKLNEGSEVNGVDSDHMSKNLDATSEVKVNLQQARTVIPKKVSHVH